MRTSSSRKHGDSWQMRRNRICCKSQKGNCTWICRWQIQLRTPRLWWTSCHRLLTQRYHRPKQMRQKRKVIVCCVMGRVIIHISSGWKAFLDSSQSFIFVWLEQLYCSWMVVARFLISFTIQASRYGGATRSSRGQWCVPFFSIHIWGLIGCVLACYYVLLRVVAAELHLDALHGFQLLLIACRYFQLLCFSNCFWLLWVAQLRSLASTWF